ncbi:2-dehydropantoate 2-reductase N-terminal domain-containing protein [Microbacterium sp. EST19A]|uniref:2-dehydropantoate 2-reductase N-terminal domain-containing protein n=1 Tax=Microbacterium sp. EST19A TaxID=2862681 RepID=UPI001CC07AFD|nr:2-dehydropantoate 2-reductase N-terminal domain-containing protein [Microbacterium sp. EST19A]
MSTREQSDLEILMIGAGSLGAAISLSLARVGRKVGVWGRDIPAARSRLRALSEIDPSSASKADRNVSFVSSERLRQRAPSAILVALPVFALAPVMTEIEHRLPHAPIVHMSKGLEPGTGRTATQVLAASIRRDRSPEFGVLSGANAAHIVASGSDRTRAVLAAPTITLAHALVGLLETDDLTLAASDDVSGVELAGALKNVAAFGYGLTVGMGVQDRFAVRMLARSIEEIMVVLVAEGASADTLASAAFIEDVLETALLRKSRSFGAGVRIGAGDTPEALPNDLVRSEGFVSSKAILSRIGGRCLGTPMLNHISTATLGKLDSWALISELRGR